MARALVLAAALLACLVCAGAASGAAVGGDLVVTTSRHPVAGHAVRILATGRVPREGVLYVYRNRGARCATTQRGQERLGSRRAKPLRAPLAVEDAFDMEARYTPKTPGRETICTYLYTKPAMTGLPPDVGFFSSTLKVRRVARSA